MARKGGARRAASEQAAAGEDEVMDAIVVYESLWGNTAEVARAVAEGLGPGARALRADEAGPDVVAGAELVVAGAPVFGFKLSSPRCATPSARTPARGRPGPLVPAAARWLEGLPRRRWLGSRVRHAGPRPFGKGAPEIARAARGQGLRQLAEPEGFVVKGDRAP